MLQTTYEHIVLDDSNVPLISSTTMKVVELVAEHLGYEWSPEELHSQHPYLSLGQIHSALAYYWDHKDDLDADIERRRSDADVMATELDATELKARLRSRISAK